MKIDKIPKKKLNKINLLFVLLIKITDINKMLCRIGQIKKICCSIAITIT